VNRLTTTATAATGSDRCEHENSQKNTSQETERSHGPFTFEICPDQALPGISLQFRYDRVDNYQCAPPSQMELVRRMRTAMERAHWLGVLDDRQELFVA
jgi:hypothetical protein